MAGRGPLLARSKKRRRTRGNEKGSLLKKEGDEVGSLPHYMARLTADIRKLSTCNTGARYGQARASPRTPESKIISVL